MKTAVVLLVLIPLVLSNPIQDKRSFLDSIFQGSELQHIIDQIVAVIGTDPAEKACEDECHKVIQQNHLLQFGCPLVCNSFKALVNRFGHATTTAP